MYSRGLLDLCSIRDDAPNPQETGGPRKFRGQVGWGGSMENPVERGGREEVGCGIVGRVDGGE